MGIDVRKRNDLNSEARATDGAHPVDYSQPSPAARVRELLVRAGLGQRAAARELEIDERTMRYYCSETADRKPPRMVFLALERLVDMRREVRS